MTRIVVKTSGGVIKGFDVSGHSGYAEEGSDIVCSAVSALTQTAALGIIEVVGVDAGIRQSEGRLALKLPENLPEQAAHDCRIILETMLMGLGAVQKEYDKYLEITQREV